MAKFFRVPTDSSCFLKTSVKSKKKGLYVLKCPVLSENVGEEQKRSSRSQTSCSPLKMSVKMQNKRKGLHVLFSPENVSEEQKKRSSRPQMSCSPLKMSVKREKRFTRPRMFCFPLKMSVKSKKNIFT